MGGNVVTYGFQTQTQTAYVISTKHILYLTNFGQYVHQMMRPACRNRRPIRNQTNYVNSALGSLNRVPALFGWVKDGNVTSAGWQVTLCDPIWHVSFRIAVWKTAICEMLYPVTYLLRYSTDTQTITSHTLVCNKETFPSTTKYL